MNDNLQIIWRGEIIGELISNQPDMWYLDGEWISLNNHLSQEFEKRISKFNAKEIISNPSKGTWILLKSQQQDIQPMHALILSFDQKNLFMRRIIDQDVVKWLLKNVKQ